MKEVSRMRSLATEAVLGLGVALLTLVGCGGNEMMDKKVGWTEIQADLKTKCALAGCHDKDTPTNTLKLDLTAGKEMENYNLTKTFIKLDMPEQSPLLTKALGTAHTGGAVFRSTSDATYTKWLEWIKAGAPFASQ